VATIKYIEGVAFNQENSVHFLAVNSYCKTDINAEINDKTNLVVSMTTFHCITL